MSQQKIAFLFPGQGSQYAGMGKDLYDNYPEARAVFQEADEALGFALSTLCFEGPEEQLKLTENTQPAIVTVSTAAARVLAAHGVAPAMAAGHSLGEYSAHVAAGTITFADAVRTVRNRGRYMQEAVPPGEGAMAALLGLNEVSVQKVCAQTHAETGGVVSAANINSPEQIVISGARHAVKQAAELAKGSGAKRAVMLPVSAPFHSALMLPAERRLAADLAQLSFADPAVPVVCNVDATPVTTGEAARDALTRQVTGAVRWVECVEVLRNMGGEKWIEVGPGKVLFGLLRGIDRALAANAAATDGAIEKLWAGESER